MSAGTYKPTGKYAAITPMVLRVLAASLVAGGVGGAIIVVFNHWSVVLQSQAIAAGGISFPLILLLGCLFRGRLLLFLEILPLGG